MLLALASMIAVDTNKRCVLELLWLWRQLSTEQATAGTYSTSTPQANTEHLSMYVTLYLLHPAKISCKA